ncbi:MAG: 2OG-Fe(II) oxygenase family protein [Sphingomicrobium sp.]
MSTIVKPVDPARVLDNAIEALNRHDRDLPLADVDRALAQAPHDYRLWHIKGLIHREQEQRELALPALRRAAELAPAEPLVAHGLARTSLEAGLPSVEPFARALKLAPGNTDLVTGLAAALVAEGRIDDAIDGLQTVLRRSPLWTDGHVLLANLRWVSGEREGFTRSFDEALQAHPNSLELRREQMVALLHAEQFDRVLELVQEGQGMFGPHPLFIAHEAVVRSETGDVENADRLFAELAPLDVATFDLRIVRHLLRSARADQAVTLLDKWLDTPDQEMFWPYAPTAWRMTGDPREEWLEGDERLVGVYDITDKLPPLESLASLLRKLHNLHGQPLSQSVRGGTQTDGNLFQRIEPEIVALREAIRRAVAEHARDLPKLDERHPLTRGRPSRIQFSGAWSVRLQAGGQHANHVHPMGWLSSALYIQLPPDLGGAGQSGWLALGEPQAQLGLDLPPRRMIEPKSGRLALFPSWMWHGTRPFGEGERITVAFDVARGG